MLAFRVYGVALPKGNMRPRIVRTKSGMQIPIVTESNRNVRSWQQLVKEGANQALNELAPGDRALLPLGVRLTIAFYLPRPKKHAKRGVFVPHCVAPDCDKLLRSVLDALTSIVYHDDKQVTEIVAGKYYAEVDGASYVDIRVEAAGWKTVAVPAAPLPLFELAVP
jgi:Holliday junction resolvase RusA-like endonuclease